MLSFMKIFSFSKTLIPTATSLRLNLNHLSFTQHLIISNDISSNYANHTEHVDSDQTDSQLPNISNTLAHIESSNLYIGTNHDI